jgi:class 3 adenylate cyclase
MIAVVSSPNRAHVIIEADSCDTFISPPRVDGLPDRVVGDDSSELTNFGALLLGGTEGPVIGRDGDIFGRTVNVAARISDVAPSGALYMPVATGETLAERYLVEPAGTATLAGVAAVELSRVGRRGPTEA